MGELVVVRDVTASAAGAATRDHRELRYYDGDRRRTHVVFLHIAWSRATGRGRAYGPTSEAQRVLTSEQFERQLGRRELRVQHERNEL